MAKSEPTERAHDRLRAHVRPRATLRRYLAVSISEYSDGALRATAGRLDTASNRMRFSALPEPAPAPDCAYPMHHWLAEAAVQLLAESHDDQPPLW